MSFMRTYRFDQVIREPDAISQLLRLAKPFKEETYSGGEGPRQRRMRFFDASNHDPLLLKVSLAEVIPTDENGVLSGV
jgi:hypothetical protein